MSHSFKSGFFLWRKKSVTILEKKKREDKKKLFVLLACFTVCFLSMEQALAAPGGTITSVLLGGLEILIGFVSSLVLSGISRFIDLGIATMSFDQAALDKYLGSNFSVMSSSLETARYSANYRATAALVVLGFAMYAVFLVSEIAKIPLATILGEDRGASRPGALAVRGIMYGAMVIASMPFAKFMLVQAGRIYNALFRTFLSSSSVYDIVTEKHDAIHECFVNAKYDEIKIGTESAITDSAARCILEILTFLLLLLVVVNLAKLLLECAQRIGQLILLIYLSPLAVSCGVSPSLSGIAFQWLKTFISTLLLWIMDIIVLAGATYILGHEMTDPTLNDYVVWAFLAFAFIKAGQQLDDLFNAVGASVVRSSGSLLGDFMEMSSAGKLISGAAKSAFGAVKGVAKGASAIASETGRITTGASRGASARPGQLRSGGQIVAGAIKGGLAASAAGQFVGRGVQGVSDLKSAVTNFSNERSLHKEAARSAAAVSDSLKKQESALENTRSKYRDPKTGKLPDLNTPKGQAMAKELRAQDNKFKAEMMSRSTAINGNPVLKENLAKNMQMNGQSFSAQGYKTETVAFDDRNRLSATFTRVDPATGEISTVKLKNIKETENGMEGMNAGGFTVSGDERTNTASFSKTDEHGNETKYNVSEVDKNPDGSRSYRVDEINDNGQVIASNLYSGADENATAMDVAHGLADDTYSGVMTRRETVKTDEGSYSREVPVVVPISSASYQGNGAMFGFAEVKSTTPMDKTYETGNHVVQVSYESIHGTQRAEIATGTVSGQDYSYFMSQDGEIRMRSVDRDDLYGDSKSLNSDVAGRIINDSGYLTDDMPGGEHIFSSYRSEDGNYKGAYELFTGEYNGSEGLFVIAGTGDNTVVEFREGYSTDNANQLDTRAKEIIRGDDAPSDGYTRLFNTKDRNVGGTDGLFLAASEFDNNPEIRNTRSVATARLEGTVDTKTGDPLMFGTFFKKK